MARDDYERLQEPPGAAFMQTTTTAAKARMSDSADDIVKRMQLVRRHVGEDVKGIVETAKTLSDWRYHVKHHPWILLGGAVAMGFLVAPKRRKIAGDEAKELVALL